METRPRPIPAQHAEVPPPSPFLLALYYVAVRFRLGWNFRSLRIANPDRFPADNQPVIVFMNHPSWWDPAVGLLIHHRFHPGGSFYAPIDETALARVPYLRRLGFFPIRTGSISGTRRFFIDARSVLSRPGAILWVTPEGEFTDPRERPIRLRRGLAKLLSTLRLQNSEPLETGRQSIGPLTLLPMALEYPFWDGIRPDILASFGEPIHIEDGKAIHIDEWHQILTQALTSAQNDLAEMVVNRQAGRFHVLFFGPPGPGAFLRLLRGLLPLFRRTSLPKTKGQP
ncbi:lysophospholipid acyltransferase family protein [Paracidobacterium acidisoli]|uniref:Phospholipid/glycerol acyltransferase domain-containing protein n=1 Tax=Paracidobacterium acidisoli TaxID=2303751 RepID=A0A372IP31_9BACT|nr:lysophospholipid acyltransferase family protein [Paracidobacterium acidisoli]MBT9330945.1 lysophospholipid acyltransferase family protein [Paracidobacterium acidisoli]